jgi:uncharacterized membrane protein YoaK (UPF0700 family)
MADATRSHQRSHHAHPQHWVFVGGAALAGVAGYVNTILLSVYHVPVSHMSGAVSMFGYDLESGDTGHLLRIASMVVGFLLGAIISGVIIGGTTLKPGRRYGVALMLEGGLLAVGSWRVIAGDLGGLSFVAAACGLQNGMASSYLGLILRTTHVTGIVTDIGVLIGHWLRHRTVEPWKLLLLTALFLGFAGGGLTGAFAHHWLGLHALWIAAGGCFAAGAVYFFWRLRTQTVMVRARPAEPVE